MSKRENKKVKGVSFNLDDPAEKELYKSILRRNFSGYVKKLIAADLAQRKVQKTQPKEEKPKPSKTSSSSTTQQQKPFFPR